MTRAQSRTAVVLGGSVAGMLAAAALAERYPTVIIVERDRLPNGPQHRRGVPQAHHIHALLAGGQRAVERLLPGITADLAADGAPVGDPLADVRVRFNGHRFRRGSSGLTLVSASRRLIEHHIRRRVLTLPGIDLLDHCDVVGLVVQAGRIDGVRVLRRADNSVEELLDADLVVDATGRGSRLPTWLADAGHPAPRQERMAVDLGYVTRCYRMPESALDGLFGVIDGPQPDRPRGLALSRLEGATWMLTLIGLRGDHPPMSADGFDRFLASIGNESVTAAIDGAEPIDAPVAFRFPASTRRRYEQTTLPGGLLVLGDSLCSFNPVYGQGISVAALEALALRDRLSDNTDPDGGDRPDTTRLMRDLAAIIDVPWTMSLAADRAFTPDAAGARLDERLLAGFIDRVQSAATRDTVAGSAFLRVVGLVDHPRYLFRPGVVWRAIHPSGLGRHHAQSEAGATPELARD